MRKWALASVVLLVALGAMGFSPAGSSAGTSSFPDVTPDTPYADAITALVHAQVISGFDDGTFSPATMVTRQQFAKMIVLALRIPVSEADVSPFTDVEHAAAGDLYPDHYVAVCASNHIVEGTSRGKFSPDRQITWAQVITMIVRGADGLRPGVLRAPPEGYVSTWGNFDPAHGTAAAKAEYNDLLKKLPIRSKSPWETMSREELAQVLANLVVASVKDFGAVGDGQADDAVAIQKAIDKAGAMGGGIVFIPTGTYLTSRLTVSSPNITIAGVGESSILKLKAGARAGALGIFASGVTVRDIQIDGNWANQEYASGGIYATGANLQVINCYIHDTGRGDAVAVDGTRNALVSENRLENNGTDVLFESSSYSRATGNSTRASTYESLASYDPGATGLAHDNVFDSNVVRDAYVGLSSERAFHNTYSGNTIENSIAGINIYGDSAFAHSNTVTGNTIIGGPLSKARGILVAGGATNTSVTNNVIYSWGIGGGYNNPIVVYATDVLVEGNQFMESAAAYLAADRVRFVGNLIDSALHSGLYLAGARSEMLIQGNTIRNCGGDGITVEATLSNSQIVNNIFEANLRAIKFAVPYVNCIIQGNQGYDTPAAATTTTTVRATTASYARDSIAPTPPTTSLLVGQ